MSASILEKAIVLVVDDQPATLQLVLDALEASDITVLVAIDGRSALATIARLPPDLILLDAVMPGMDGFETCREIKRGPAADVPVIFMTGLEETEHVVRGLEAGGIDYLTKPIVPDELLARMRVHLTNARSVRGARTALDKAGRTLLAANAAGDIIWATPQAQRMLAPQIGGMSTRGASVSALDASLLPAEIRSWITRQAATPGSNGNPANAMRCGNIRFRLLSRVSGDEWLFVLEPEDSADAERERIQKLQLRGGLTLREAEVLYWLSRGKSNRDIADILGMSYRTVDKHLQHVYPKLGVESRTGASAATVRILEE